MTQHPCTCGYQAESPRELTFHFEEMFIPGSDIAPDGQVHAENAREMSDSLSAPATLTCRCGFTSDIDGLEQHLADVFTPADHIGLDGQKHAPVAPAMQQESPPPAR
jgi:hypothetical protein